MISAVNIWEELYNMTRGLLSCRNWEHITSLKHIYTSNRERVKVQVCLRLYFELHM